MRFSDFILGSRNLFLTRHNFLLLILFFHIIKFHSCVHEFLKRRRRRNKSREQNSRNQFSSCRWCDNWAASVYRRWSLSFSASRPLCHSVFLLDKINLNYSSLENMSITSHAVHQRYLCLTWISITDTRWWQHDSMELASLRRLLWNYLVNNKVYTFLALIYLETFFFALENLSKAS